MAIKSWTQARARVAALSRSRDDNDPELIEARRELKAMRLHQTVQDVVNSAPPLTGEQARTIAALLTNPTVNNG